jgi:prepilin-type N-terminal cleavage/methylation domain-containing protein
MKLRENTKAAFTLIELMASVAIMGVMFFLLFAAFNQTSKAWLQGESRVETFTAARAALDFMSRELAQVMVNTNALQFFGTTNAVAFIALTGDNYGARVDLAEVVYRLSQPSAANLSQPPVADPGGFFTNTVPPYRLVRRFTPYSDFPPLACYEYGQMQICGANPWDFYNNNNWMQTSATNNTQVLADNIISLAFMYVDANNYLYNQWNSANVAGVWNNELPNPGIPNNIPDTGSHPQSYTNMLYHAPAGVYITIGVIDSRTAIKLASLGTTSGSAWNTITNQAMQTFTTFVAIPNQ